MARRAIVGMLAIVLVSAALVMAYQVPVGSEQPKKVIQVIKHITPDSNITEEEMMAWLALANEIFGCSLIFVQIANQTHDKPGYDHSKNSPLGVNVWGVKTQNFKGGSPHSSSTWDNVVQLTKGGGPNNIQMKPTALAHELGHVSHLGHSSNPYNIMYADIRGGKSCNRKGSNLTDAQQGYVRAAMYRFVARDEGQGECAYDAVNEGFSESMDIGWAEGWANYTTTWMLHLTVDTFPNVDISSFDYWLSFLIESDHDPSTGEPPDGSDYLISFNPAYSLLEFSRYDFGWVPLDSAGITYEFTYAWFDSDAPPTITGIDVALPLSLLERRAGTSVSVRAVTNNMTHTDRAPDTGFLTIGNLTDPSPPPPGVPEFPSGFPFLLAAVPLLLYLWWKKRRAPQQASFHVSAE